MSTPYEDGRTACALGVRYGANPYPPSANCRAWNEGWKAEWERQAERDKADAADQRLRDVVAAIELLISAKIACAKADMDLNLDWVRENLSDKLAALIRGGIVMPIRGTCDVCDARDVTLGRATVCGIETYACATCHGHQADEFDDEPEPETAVTFRDSQSYNGP